MASGYTGERRAHLQALADLLPDQGLAGRMVGGDEPVLWVWHPSTGQRTLIFATPSADGWMFLWSPKGQGRADELERTVDALRRTLDVSRDDHG
ncbi:hypothetical protein [Nonomuraea sp. NPDC050783]|uniref:hypothetical protein n=1 Tax=Nonomuraea sp. NPDC050783 TaxID=3154634 RepID=UPI0034669F2D